MRFFYLISVIVLLISLIFSPHYFDTFAAFALNGDAPKLIKQNSSSALESLIVFDKKDQKRIDTAFESITKSLDDKYWVDDYSLSEKGKKVFDNEKKAVKELLKVKSLDVSSVILDLVEADRIIAQLAIDSIPVDSGIKKIDKLLAKAIDEMDDAQKDLDNNKPDKAIDHYKKAWDLSTFGHILDMSNTDTGTYDAENDGLIDYFLTLHYPKNSKKPIQIDYVIQDECVDLGPKDSSNIGGDTFDDAGMKIGISTNPPFAPDREWITDDVLAWNDWFKSKKNDQNKMIDLFYTDTSFPFFEDDVNGENVIQGNENGDSFTHFTSIDEIDGQSGWKGTVYFEVPSGDHILWTIHPSGGFGGCDVLSGLGVLVSIPE